MISKEEIAELYSLYETFHSAIDPFDPEIMKAEAAFFEKLLALHERQAPDVPFVEFRRYAVRQCKLYMKKN